MFFPAGVYCCHAGVFGGTILYCPAGVHRLGGWPCCVWGFVSVLLRGCGAAVSFVALTVPGAAVSPAGL